MKHLRFKPILALLGTLAVLTTSGWTSVCAAQGQPTKTAAPASKPGKDGKKEQPKQGEPKAGSWTIILAVFRGEGQEDAARLALNRIRNEGGLPEAYTEKRNQAMIVAYGKFPSADDANAQAELKRVLDIEISGVHPYIMNSYLAPPVQSDAESLGTLPQYNLVQAAAMYGSHALYTLQVGVYGRDDLKNPTEKDLLEVRKAAEKAVVTLRQEGEMAFYYHGPHRSMVTVGVFDESDFDPQTPGYNSPRLIETKKRHPQNLYNGAGIKEKTPTAPAGPGQPAGKPIERLQPSNLVAIPKK